MDNITAVGYVIVEKHDKLTGKLIYRKKFKNQITNYARSQSANLWAGIVVPTPSMISVGTGTGTTSPNDTALWNEVSGSKKNIDYATVWLTYYTQYSVTYQNTEVLGTGTNQSISLSEVGLWDNAGNLWSHCTLTNVSHDNTSTLSIQWQVLQQGN